jgi:hypothetical protein
MEGLALMTNLAEVPEYRRFVKERDVALEKLLSNARIRNTNIMNRFLTDVIRIMVSHYAAKAKDSSEIISSVRDLSHELEPYISDATVQITRNALNLRRMTYLLTVASEAEALARATGRDVRVKVGDREILKELKSKTQRDEVLLSRVRLALDRLVRKMIDRYQLSLVDGSSMEEFLDRVFLVVPKRKRMGVKRVLKPLREATAPTEKKEDISLIIGEIDPQDWNELVDEWKKDEIVTNRSAESYFDREVGEHEAEEVYEWEVEREITDDFVRAVREGQIEVAKENGVDDFVWVAVIDERTGDSDKWRDGKKLSEIQDYIDKHGADPFGNDLLSPPIHVNCRCVISPLFPGLPEPRKLPEGEFEKWLSA